MFLSVYLILINFMTFLLFGEDKKCAVKQKCRISERTLLLFAFFGGSVGALSGMYIFRHKIRKWKFRIGIPGMLFLQLLIFIFL